MRDPAGQGQAGFRLGAAVVVAAVEVGVLADGEGLGLGEGDLLGGAAGANGNHAAAPDPVRVADGPFQGAGSAHRSAQHRVPAPDAQGVCQPGLGRRRVPQGDQREA